MTTFPVPILKGCRPEKGRNSGREFFDTGDSFRASLKSSPRTERVPEPGGLMLALSPEPVLDVDLAIGTLVFAYFSW